MFAYIVKRIVTAIPVVLIILTITYFVMQSAPGDPIKLYESPEIDPMALERLRHVYGLDQPWYVQYFKWISAFILKGELGISIVQNKPVAEILKSAIPYTLLLSGIAILLDLLLGIIIGTISAVKQYSFLDHSSTLLALFFYSMPTFWLGLMLIILFSYLIPILPPSHLRSINYAELTAAGKVLDMAKHLVLPSFCLGIAAAAATARYMRASLLEVIRQDYIRTARSKGLNEPVVIFKHAMRNALLPIITLVGLYLPFLMSGALIIEVVFAYPGMGRVTFNAISGRDYPTVIACTFIASCMVIGGNMIADILYAFVDPRIRME